MNKFILLVVLFTISLSANSASNVLKTDTKNFNSMKACVEWIDSIYPNKEWHSDGMSWYTLKDTPELVDGVTFKISSDKKTRFPVSFQCEIYRSGTKGTYFEGTYSVLKSRPN